MNLVKDIYILKVSLVVYIIDQSIGLFQRNKWF